MASRRESLNLPERSSELSSWLDRHPRPAVLLRAGYASRVVQVVAVGEDAVGLLRGVTAGLAVHESARGQVAHAWFRAPTDKAFLRGSPDDGGLLLLAEGDEVSVDEDADGLPLFDVPKDLPALPASIVEKFARCAVPIDGMPRYVEVGRAGPSRYWWTTAAALRADPEAHAAPVNAIATVCTYVAPDARSAHFCALVIECDHEGDAALDLSIQDARQAVQVLRTHGVDDDAIALRYTGNKSLYVIVESDCFGQIPRLDGHEVMGRVAATLFGGKIEYDASIFHSRQKVRVLGTRHGKSGLYCIPVAVGDLATITVDELRRRAQEPRGNEESPADRHALVPALAELWARTAAGVGGGGPVGAKRERRQERHQEHRATSATTAATSAEAKRARRTLGKLEEHPACIRALIAGTTTLARTRNDCTVALIAYARTRGIEDLARRRFFKEVAPALTSTELDAAGTEKALLDGDRYAAGAVRPLIYTFGVRSCMTLRSAGLPCLPSCPARRMWDEKRKSGPQRPVPLPPDIDPITLPGRLTPAELRARIEQVREGIAAAIRAARPGGPAILIIAPPSSGKTTVGRKEMQRCVAGGKARQRVAFLGKRHDLLDALAVDWPGLVHLLPRSAETCMRFEEVETLTAAGWGAIITQHLCARCPHHPRRAAAPVVPCTYLTLLLDRKSPIAFVHDLASLTDLATSRTFIAIDEDFIASCIRARTFPPGSLSAEGLAGDATSMAALGRCVDTLRKVELEPRAYGPGELRTVLPRLVDVDQFLADADVIDWTTVGPKASGAGAGGRSASRPLRRMGINPKPLIDVLGHILRGRAGALRWTGKAWEVRWVEKPRLGNGSVVCLDGTADPEILARLVDRPVDVRRFEIPFPGVVLQVVDGKYARKSLIDRSYPGSPRVRRRTVERLLRVVEARGARVPGRTLLVTFLAVENWLGDPSGNPPSLPINVDVKHYGGLRGADLREYSQIILLGFPFAHPADILLDAEALFAGEEGVDDTTTQRVVPYAAINDWTDPDDNPLGDIRGPVGLPMRAFVDPRAERVRRLKEDAEYFQAINRIRQILDPDKITVLLTAVPADPAYRLPVRLVELSQLGGVGTRRGPVRGWAMEVCAETLQELGFISVEEVRRRQPGISLASVYRAIQELAKEEGLPRLLLRRGEGAGRPYVAHGDPAACQRHLGQAGWTVELDQAVGVQDDHGITLRDQDDSEFFSRNVEDPSNSLSEINPRAPTRPPPRRASAAPSSGRGSPR